MWRRSPRHGRPTESCCVCAPVRSFLEGCPCLNERLSPQNRHAPSLKSQGVGLKWLKLRRTTVATSYVTVLHQSALIIGNLSSGFGLPKAELDDVCVLTRRPNFPADGVHGALSTHSRNGRRLGRRAGSHPRRSGPGPADAPGAGRRGRSLRQRGRRRGDHGRQAARLGRGRRQARPDAQPRPDPRLRGRQHLGAAGVPGAATTHQPEPRRRPADHADQRPAHLGHAGDPRHPARSHRALRDPARGSVADLRLPRRPAGSEHRPAPPLPRHHQRGRPEGRHGRRPHLDRPAEHLLPRPGRPALAVQRQDLARHAAVRDRSRRLARPGELALRPDRQRRPGPGDRPRRPHARTRFGRDRHGVPD